MLVNDLEMHQYFDSKPQWR